MKTVTTKWIAFFCSPRTRQALTLRSNHKGQALVEFTLVFLLLLVVAWIPADFGLAFYTGQLAGSAAREGARIAAADPNFAAQVGSCSLPCSSGGDILQRTSYRVATALMPDTTITLAQDTTGGTCNTRAVMTVSGTYNFSFYRVLAMMGFSVPTGQTIARTTSMRWEHQC